MTQKLPTCPECGRRARPHARGLCQACYRRGLRRALGMPAAVRVADPVGVAFEVPRAVLETVRLLADREGITLSEWLRRAAAERAERGTEAPKRRGKRS